MDEYKFRIILENNKNVFLEVKFYNYLNKILKDGFICILFVTLMIIIFK